MLKFNHSKISEAVIEILYFCLTYELRDQNEPMKAYVFSEMKMGTTYMVMHTM